MVKHFNADKGKIKSQRGKLFTAQTLAIFLNLKGLNTLNMTIINEGSIFIVIFAAEYEFPHTSV